MFVRQQYRRKYGKGLPHKKPIASEIDARKMKSSARLGGLKEALAYIGVKYFTMLIFVQRVLRYSVFHGILCFSISANIKNAFPQIGQEIFIFECQPVENLFLTSNNTNATLNSDIKLK